MARTSLQRSALIVLGLFAICGADAHADEKTAGLIGIQFGSEDFDRPQRRVPLYSLNPSWSESDAYGVQWSGRWRGSIVGPVTGNVKFLLETDQIAKIEIGGKLSLDAKDGSKSGTLAMIKGEKYPIVLSFIKDGRGHDCHAKVEWSWSGKEPAVARGSSLTHTPEQDAALKKIFANGERADRDDDRRRSEGRTRYTGKGQGIAFHKRVGEMDITVDGKLFATYVWSDPRTTRPYFKQVHALGGEVQVTRNHPPKRGDFTDHETYHPGMWWGFGDVGGNDYWRMKAKIIGGTFVQEPSGGKDQGSFSVRNRMLTNGGKQTFCHQVCRYTILKRSGGILLISESAISRDAGDFWLGDQEEMGMAIRVATPIAAKSGKGGRIQDSEGRTALKKIRTNQSDWCDYSGPIAGKHGGILLMNDPRNFRKPWWHAVDTGLLIANPLGESELNGRGKKRQNVLVKKGTPFRMRYGVLIHLHDSKDKFEPAKAYKDFVDLLPSVDKKPQSAKRTELPSVPDGFNVSAFASEPRVYKPTAICFDPQGRLMVGQGPQYPKNFENTPADSVVLLIDSDNDGVADASRTFATGFNSIQGLAWKGDDLYVANAPELTVVRDLDGDDEADEYIVVYTDLGNREHALHGLNWGPDGKLYMSKGNSKGHNQPEKYGYVAPRPFRELWDVVHPPNAPDSYPPKKFTKHNYKKTYHHWDDDWGREGGVLRCDPLGKNLQIVSRGMRNPWDITMDDGFNWLGTDNDQDQGDRIMMPFFGAHFGWGHSYSSHWTGHKHLPTAPISGPVFPGSGAGIIYYAHRHFPAEYQNTFFINDWMHGTFVYRPVWEGALMQPAGGRWTPFATRGKGKMLYRPTDLEFGPDGAIYICGWGGDYHYSRDGDGSWMFRVTHAEGAATKRSDWLSSKRKKRHAEWTFGELVEDLGPDALPIWRVDSQDELVRRGDGVRAELIQAVLSRKLSQGQQTWAIWALGRISPVDPAIDTLLAKWAERTKPDAKKPPLPLNVRVQSLRILAYRHGVRGLDQRRASPAPVPAALPLADAEPRVRFEAVQCLWQARRTDLLAALINQLAVEDDRIVFYAGWQAIRDLTDVAYRKNLLADQRPRVRLAGLLSLLEGHQISLDEVLKIAETDPDPEVQSWSLTWAMNPRPPKKHPNSTSRIEFEESVSMRDLIDRVHKAKTKKLRRLYLTMVSRATYRRGDDWKRLRDLYGKLSDDAERALVIAPLSREDGARPILWDALSGNDALRQAAVRGFVVLSRRSDNSPERIAGYLLEKMAKSPRASRAVECLARLEIQPGWRPPSHWDATLAQAFGQTKDVTTRSRILGLLMVMDADQLSRGSRIKQALEAVSRDPAPQLYAALVTLNPRLGINVQLKPPMKATVQGVLGKLDRADARRGRELFFSKASSTACAQCHRVFGRGNNFAPDLSGIGLRSEPKKIVEAILDPSATITEGYERQLIVTKDGLTIEGAVLQENGAQVRVIKTDGNLETIAVGSIESRKKTKVSAMPVGFALLGDNQVADIAAYLASCRHGSSAPATRKSETTRQGTGTR